MAYPNSNKDSKMLEIKTKDDEIKDLKNKTEKHGRENILKTPENDIDYFKKKN